MLQQGCNLCSLCYRVPLLSHRETKPSSRHAASFFEVSSLALTYAVILNDVILFFQCSSQNLIVLKSCYA